MTLFQCTAKQNTSIHSNHFIFLVFFGSDQLRFKNGKTAGVLTIQAFAGQFIYTNANVSSITVPVLGTATLVCAVGTAWVQF